MIPSPMAAMGGAHPGMMGQGMQGMFAAPQPPTPEQMALLDKPSWEQVVSLLRDKVHRGYRIDIETDSTIAGSLESDMAGMSQIMQAVSVYMRETMPLVQSGMLPIEAQKEMLMSITRRARMGMVVEDALDKMQAPKPPQDPSQAKAQVDAQKAQLDAQIEAQKLQMQEQFEERSRQAEMAMEQQKLQMQAQFEEQRAQNEMRIAQAEQAYQAQQDAQQQQLEHERELQRQAYEERLEQMRMAMEERISAREKQIELLIAQMNNAAKIEVAEIGKQGGVIAEDQIVAAVSAADDARVD